MTRPELGLRSGSPLLPRVRVTLWGPTGVSEACATSPPLAGQFRAGIPSPLGCQARACARDGRWRRPMKRTARRSPECTGTRPLRARTGIFQSVEEWGSPNRGEPLGTKVRRVSPSRGWPGVTNALAEDDDPDTIARRDPTGGPAAVTQDRAKHHSKGSRLQGNEHFSVIIPTLQRSHRLHALLHMYARHPDIAEIIVVNNAPRPFQHPHDKVRILNQDQNLFVNPSWNLGVQESNHDLLIISNDDIRFPPDLITHVRRFLLDKSPGLVGPDPAAFNSSGHNLTFRRSYSRTDGYGTLMFLHRVNYVPVPEELLIWCGDDWLWTRQSRKNYAFKGAPIYTEMSTTSGSAEFSLLKERDVQHYEAKYDQPGAIHLDRRIQASRTAVRAWTTKHLKPPP